MKTKIRKLIALCAAVAMLTCILTSCQNNESDCNNSGGEDNIANTDASGDNLGNASEVESSISLSEFVLSFGSLNAEDFSADIDVTAEINSSSLQMIFDVERDKSE